MRNFYEYINKIPLLNKIILIILIGLSGYYLVSTVIDYNNSLRINEEIRNLNFKVSRIYFEHGNTIRTVFDEAIFINLTDSVTKEQFEKMTFEIPGERVSAEYISDRKLKVNLGSEFTVSKENYLEVRFYNKNIYKFNYKSSSVDKDYFKDLIPDKSPMSF